MEQGYKASRFAAISLLSAIKAELDDLNRVKRIVKVLGMVNSDPAFIEPKGYQWRFRPFGSGFRRLRQARAFGRGCLSSNFRHCGRDRDDSRASLGKLLYAVIPHFDVLVICGELISSRVKPDVRAAVSASHSIVERNGRLWMPAAPERRPAAGSRPLLRSPVERTARRASTAAGGNARRADLRRRA